MHEHRIDDDSIYVVGKRQLFMQIPPLHELLQVGNSASKHQRPWANVNNINIALLRILAQVLFPTYFRFSQIYTCIILLISRPCRAFSMRSL